MAVGGVAIVAFVELEVVDMLVAKSKRRRNESQDINRIIKI